MVRLASPNIAAVVQRLCRPTDSKYRMGHQDRPQAVALTSKAATAQRGAGEIGNGFKAGARMNAAPGGHRGGGREG
jgi:hypothetical protein